MNSAKWNWILLTILASHFILTSTVDTQCSPNDDSTSMASWQSFFSILAKASYDKCHSTSSANLGNLTSTIVKQFDEIKQLIQEERAECQKKIEELNSSLCEKIDQLMDYVTSDCPPLEEEEITLCNITSSDWRRVAYIKMTDPEAECPIGLNEVSNSNTGQRACGRSVDGAGYTVAAPGGCSLVTFPVKTIYSHVCGYARGYAYRSMDAFWKSPIRTINDSYVDGLSITHGNPRKHLWTLAVGTAEAHTHLEAKCPLDLDTYNISRIPEFVGNNYYCEGGYSSHFEARIAWEDPLWDGQQCVSSTAKSCSRYGWFHREIAPSQEDIEVRWCSDEIRSDEDFYTDLLEIWVL